MMCLFAYIFIKKVKTRRLQSHDEQCQPWAPAEIKKPPPPPWRKSSKKAQHGEKVPP